MKIKTAFLMMCVALLHFATPVFSHHAFTAEYDSSKLRQFTGTVTKVEFLADGSKIGESTAAPYW